KESRRLDRVEKSEEYRLSGTKEYWLIDPENRSAELFELDENGQYFPIPVNQSGTFRSSVLAGFWLDPNWLWSDPRPTVREVASALGLL
ncbi:MAG TPA: Uma2 family endonuclease, partial [Pyrinomonadaceae bacterium]|nr:Uma2 family endonuclease [Pyrinomonadaceae bacterium]